MENKTKYILNTFFTYHKIDRSKIDIHYGINLESKIQIKQSELIYIFNDNFDINYKNVVYKKWLNTDIPFLFDRNTEKEIFEEIDGNIIINYDIIASSFYLLSGYSETVAEEKDELGRILYKNSIQHKLKITEIPVVNYYFNILKTAIEKAYNKKIETNIWGKFKFATCLTHDIDYIRTPWTANGLKNIFTSNIVSTINIPIKKITQTKSWLNFKEIINIEKKYNAKSTFFILPNNKKSEKGYDNADYTIKDIAPYLEFIESEGFEIGIHPSICTHKNCSSLKTEITKLAKYNPQSCRFHFLIFRPETTMNTLEVNNLNTDSTLGFTEHIGFRNSFCLPFYLYNFENDKQSKILEIPLNIMDVTLFDKRFMNISHDKVLSRIENIIKEIEKFNGVLIINWHNNYLSDFLYKGWKDLYIKLLDKLHNKNSLLTDVYTISTQIKNIN